MNLYTETPSSKTRVAIYIISGVLIFILVNYIFWSNYDFVGSQQLNNYWQMFAAFAILIGAGALINDYWENAHQHQNEQEQIYINQTEGNWIELEKYFASNYPYSARLYQQMYSHNPTLRGLPKDLDAKEMDKVRDFEQHTCIILFQIIENIYIYLSARPGNTDYCGWVKVWKSWFKSSIILEQWKFSKQFYDNQTQLFIDLCIIGNCPKVSELCMNEINEYNNPEVRNYYQNNFSL